MIYCTVFLDYIFFTICSKSLGIVPVSNFISNLKNASCDLKHSSLGPKGMQAVATALIQNNYITELSLCDNCIHSEGTVYLEKLLLENFNITKIDASENEIRSVGAHSMARVIKENNSLLSMSLAENNFKDKDANVLAEALKHNCRLRHFDLSRNKFSEEAGLCLGKFSFDCCACSHQNFTPQAILPLALIYSKMFGKNFIIALFWALGLVVSLVGNKELLVKRVDCLKFSTFRPKVSPQNLFT